MTSKELTEKQIETLKAWTSSGAENLCSDFIIMPSGEIACIQRFLFTYAIVYGISEDLYLDRWCFHSYQDALFSLQHWVKNFENMLEPIGWHRHPTTGRYVYDDRCEIRR